MTRPLLTLLALPFLLTACGDGGAPSAPASKVDFTADIKPLLESRCVNCHNTGTLLGELNLESKKLAFTPGSNGPFIVPGDPQASRLYTFTLRLPPDHQAMPPTKHRLTDAEQKLLHDWIEQGASWPEGPEGILRVLQEPAS